MAYNKSYAPFQDSLKLVFRGIEVVVEYTTVPGCEETEDDPGEDDEICFERVMVDTRKGELDVLHMMSGEAVEELEELVFKKIEDKRED